jgi:hypothetical protein
LAQTLATCTGIDAALLDGTRLLSDYSIAQRMSWASRRQTTRVEDTAYSLMGIFDVNMPLLYGEGIKAFKRLQEEIIRASTDHTIFAWTSYRNPSSSRGVLATSPADFWHSKRIVSATKSGGDSAFAIRNSGLEIRLPLLLRKSHGETICLGLLNCYYDDSPEHRLGIFLKPSLPDSLGESWPSSAPLVFGRVRSCALEIFDWDPEPNWVVLSPYSNTYLSIPSQGIVPDFSTMTIAPVWTALRPKPTKPADFATLTPFLETYMGSSEYAYLHTGSVLSQNKQERMVMYVFGTQSHSRFAVKVQWSRSNDLIPALFQVKLEDISHTSRSLGLLRDVEPTGEAEMTIGGQDEWLVQAKIRLRRRRENGCRSLVLQVGVSAVTNSATCMGNEMD